MKVCTLLAILLLPNLYAPGQTLPPPQPDMVTVSVSANFTITLTWKYNYTHAYICNLSPTITVGCVRDFTWGYISGGKVPLAEVSTAACVPGPVATPQPETCTSVIKSSLPIGSITFYVVANYFDNNGVLQTSAAGSTGPVTIHALQPFSVKESHI